MPVSHALGACLMSNSTRFRPEGGICRITTTWQAPSLVSPTGPPLWIRLAGPEGPDGSEQRMLPLSGLRALGSEQSPRR